MTCWENKGEAGSRQDAWDGGCSSDYPIALWGKVLDREGTATWTMLDSGQTNAVHFSPLNSGTRSFHQSYVYEVCIWYGLWDMNICVAVVVFSGVGAGWCVCKWSLLPHLLAAPICWALFACTAATFYVTQSFPLEGRKWGPGDG